jgi:hypothetical protein
LPYLHIDSHLFGLSGQAEGFGFQAIGGLHGEIYHVTSLAGSSPNSNLYHFQLCRQRDLPLFRRISRRSDLLHSNYDERSLLAFISRIDLGYKTTSQLCLYIIPCFDLPRPQNRSLYR